MSYWSIQFELKQDNILYLQIKKDSSTSSNSTCYSNIINNKTLVNL